jgi:hypothetical protein
MRDRVSNHMEAELEIGGRSIDSLTPQRADVSGTSQRDKTSQKALVLRHVGDDC